MHPLVATITRTVRRSFSSGWLLVAFVLLLSLGIAGQQPDRESIVPESFVSLLEYVTTDYETAVRDGAIVNDFEYREMQELSGLLVDHFDDLLGLGASEEIRTGLLELQKQIRLLSPPAAIRTRGEELVDRLLTELEIRSLPVDAPDPKRGRAFFGPNCAPCHGAVGRGDGPSSPGMDPPPRSFRSPRMNHFSHHQVYGAISFGIEGTAMPTFRGAFKSEDIWDITFFVMSLREQAAPGSEEIAGSGGYRDSGAAAILATVETLRSDPDPRFRRWAAWTLDRSGSISPAVVDGLLAGLRDDDELVREYAAGALGRLGAGVAPRLTEAITTNPTARPHAETALIAMGGPAVPEIVRLLEQGGPVGQSSAVRILTEIGPAAESAIPHLIGALGKTQSRASGVRLAAALGSIGVASVAPLLQLFESTDRPFTQELIVKALGFVGPDASDTVPLLLDALDDASGRLRFTAASALGQIRSVDAVTALADRVQNDTSHSVRMHAIAALGSIGPAAKPAAPVLVAVFAQSDDNLAGRAAQALGKMGKPVLPKVLEASKNADSRTRAYAALALGQIDVGADRKVPRLVAMLRDEDKLVRDKAAVVLVGLGDVAVPYLVETLTDDPDWRARGHAALALGRMTPPSVDAVPSLTAAIDDANETVRQIACWSLGEIGPGAAPAVTKLSDALKSPDVGLRRTAAWALGNVGSAAMSAQPALESLLNDPQPTVRQEADEALQKLHGTYEFVGAATEGE